MNRSTRIEIRDVVVGLAVTFVVIAGMALVFSPGAISGGSYRVQASFGQTDGLSVGSPVRAAGVTVGEVAALDLADGFRVLATLEIDNSVELDTDASAAILTDGIFGEKLVQLDIGGGAEMIEDGGAIAYTEDAVVLDDLLNLIISQARATHDAPDLEDTMPAPDDPAVREDAPSGVDVPTLLGD